MRHYTDPTIIKFDTICRSCAGLIPVGALCERRTTIDDKGDRLPQAFTHTPQTCPNTGKGTKWVDSDRYWSARNRLKDDDNPEIGDYPPLAGTEARFPMIVVDPDTIHSVGYEAKDPDTLPAAAFVEHVEDPESDMPF
jgi:hypothetical protein